MSMNDYPAIGDHGLIGDLQTCALVSSDGTVDWFCPGRFDAPSVFGSLLDRERGGSFRVWVPGATSTQMYVPDTAVLVTRFVAADGAVGEVVDFMVPGLAETAIYRILRGVHGRVGFEMECRPQFDYGRADGGDVRIEQRGGAGVAVFESSLALFGTTPLAAAGDSAMSTVELAAGESAAFLLVAEPLDSGDRATDVARGPMQSLLATELRESGGSAAEVAREAERSLAAVEDFWRDWTSQSTYRGRWPEAVHRSAITLKLLTHAPTGAIIAAATTALPEEIGGERNWDYRYTWIRDGALSARALLDLGFREEAEAFARWVTERLADGPNEAGEPLSIMYRVDGSNHLIEETLPDWEGYRGSAPVRIGNGAALQLQLDIYGELLYSLAGTEHLRGEEGRVAIAKLLDWLANNWDRPDEGIWETRGGRRDFTYSRLMCWAAFEFGLRIAPEHHNAGIWAVCATAIADQVRGKAWDEAQGSYVQNYDDPALDASLLFAPLVGFVADDDPRWVSTLAAIERGLTEDGLCHRYRLSDFSDGLDGDEASFDLCTLLFHTALARAGQADRARWEFTKFLSHAGPTGLFAEELTPAGGQLGNFPQAFTHLGVIQAALAIDAALDARDAARQARQGMQP